MCKLGGRSRQDVGLHFVQFSYIVADCSVVVEPLACVADSKSVLWQRLVASFCDAMNNEHNSVTTVRG
jgi:hypothetical protein